MSKTSIIRLKLIAGLFLMVAQFSWGQTEGDIVKDDGKQFLLYKVEAGQSIGDLSRKFDLSKSVILQYNPQLVFGITEGDIVKVLYEPNNSYTSSETNKTAIQTAENSQLAIDEDFIYHLVKKKETVYSISKQYNIPIEAIYQYNPEAKKGVLTNEILRIPKNPAQVANDGLLKQDDSYFYHQILAGETLYGIAKRYNSSVTSIIEENPQIENNFNIGTGIRIAKTIENKEIVFDANTDQYFMHRVELGETFYSYKRRFGAKQEDLIQLNPVLKEGLKAGIEIKIPTQNIPEIKPIPQTPEEFQEYLVSSGETLYGISKKKNLKIREIKNANPELKTRGLVAGETILLPIAQVNNDSLSAAITDTIDQNEKVIDIKKKAKIEFEISALIPSKQLIDEEEIVPDDTFKITMFIPLFYQRNEEYNLEETSEEEFNQLDSIRLANTNTVPSSFEVVFDSLNNTSDTIFIDTLRVKENRSLISVSKSMLSFFEGFVLAIDSLQSNGQNIELNVIDSEHSKAKIDSIMDSEMILNSDLIVGPVSPVLQGKVANISAKNQIPMVSPLSADHQFLQQNPYYFQVSPSKEYILRKTAEFIADEYYNKNFIVLTLGNDKQLNEIQLVDRVREKFFSTAFYKNQSDILFTEVDFTAGETLGYWHLKKVLKKNEENIVFIPTTDDREVREAMLSRAINSLYVLSEEFDITLVGMNDYPRFKSINVEYFHRLNLHYLTSTYVDYKNKNVNNFIRKYRADFKTEPNEYAFRGYDIAWFFGKASNKFGKNFVDYISGFKVDQLQDDLNFQRTDELQGFMNYSLNLINFTENWEVKPLSKITEGRTVLPIAEN